MIPPDLLQVHTSSALPLYSILVTVSVSTLLALINIASAEAFEALTSLTVTALYSSYMVSAGSMLYRQLSGTLNVRWGPFKMGRASIPVNVFSLAYTVVAWIFAFFSESPNPGVRSLNWSGTVFGGSLIFCLTYWWVSARKQYTGPRVEVDREGVELIDHLA